MLEHAPVERGQAEAVQQPADAARSFVKGQVGRVGEDVGFSSGQLEMVADVVFGFGLIQGRQLVGE